MTKLNKLMKKAPEHTLREFARKCALRNIQKIKPYCSDENYQVIVTWLNTGDESIRQDASSAVESAADSAVESAAYWAYWAALSACWTAYDLTCWTAYDLTYWAADSAADSAYWTVREAANSAANWAAKSAAKSAEIQWQEQTLSEMMEN